MFVKNKFKVNEICSIIGSRDRIFKQLYGFIPEIVG